MRKFVENWIFHGIAFFMFATLFVTMMLEINTLTVSALIAYSASVLAYTMMLTGTFIASRPRFIEKRVGMPKMYEIHAVMTVYAMILVFIHIVIIWQGFDQMFRSPATIAGYVGTFAILFAMLSGMLSLSGMFVNNSKTLRNLKEKVLNREVMLWIHRICAIVAVVAVYLHQYLIGFLRSNTPYMVLLTIYSVVVLGYYFVWKLKTALLPKYIVSEIYKATPLLWIVEFKPQHGTISNYTPGDYFFIRFKTGEITKEAHPFSTSSAITKDHHDSIQFMIKEAGDWTRSLANIKVGDIATLEGPYGDFYPQEIRESDDPFVLMGGGIGLTPNLSILRSEIDKGSQRKICLVWALSWESDMFMVDELESYKKVNPNFEYHIIFSNEKVDGYAHGFISSEFLNDIGVASMYQQARFFICGPDIMMESTKKVLLSNGVPLDHIRVDEFGF